MKKSVIFLLIGSILGVLVWKNVERVMEGRQANVATIDGKNVLPPAPPSGSKSQVSETRAAASKLERVVVNIDTLGQPLQTDWGLFGGRSVQPQGSGSGVIIREDGFVVTNHHVVANAQSITVTTWDGKQYSGQLWATDPSFDLAVVKINKDKLPFAVLGNSDSIEVGDSVIAVGNALGLGTTVTSGIISATERSVPDSSTRGLSRAIQTDAAINRGNSGGALALLNGEVIGINTAILSTQGGGNIGIGFAIPSNTVREVVTQLIRTRQAIPMPWLGIEYGNNSPEIAGMLEQQGITYPNSNGIIVIQVLQGSPAQAGGIRPFDNILLADGKEIKDTRDFQRIIQAKKPDETLKIQLYRPSTGRKVELEIKLGSAPAMQAAPQQPQQAPRRILPLPF